MTLDLESEIPGASLDLQGVEYAHAAIMHGISSVDPELGQTIHDAKRHKPLSIAVIASAKQHGVLRVAFLGRQGLAAADALITSLSATPMLRLGHVLWRVTDICVGGTQWTGISTWADLMADGPGRRIDFDFVTPTAITKCDGKRQRVMSLLPDPVDLFSGLAERWEELDGPVLPSGLGSYLLKRGCVVSELQIHTETSKLSERIQKGFVGHVMYLCSDTDLHCLAALQQLARFAAFSGVGYQTARGMGAVITRLGR